MRPILLEPDAVVSGGMLSQHPTQVLVVDGYVEAVGVGLERAAKDAERRPLGGTLLPGLIDLQVNGAGGRSVDEATPEALDEVARAVRRGGAAAFLPTLITAPFDALLEQIRRVAEWIERGPPFDGAEPLGIHVEGPFLEASGAHDASLFCDPTPERLDALIEAGQGQIALVTLASSRDEAPHAVRTLRQAGIRVAIGHVVSTDGFVECIDSGASLVTHLFNAMGPFHHRAPGIAGLALDDPRPFCSLIVDGVHVDPIVVRIATRCLGLDRTVLVTDSVAPAGMPDGEYRLGDIELHSENGIVRDADGRLAGSALTMAQAIANFAEFVGDHLEVTDRPSAEVIAEIASINPGLVLEDAEYGDITPGHRALFTRFSDFGEIEVYDPEE